MRTDFWTMVKAELFMLRKRPGTWVIFGIWLAVTVAFAYALPYFSYTSGGTDFAESFDSMLPAAVPQTIAEGMPFYGGALVLILGVLTIGSEFGWGTWKTVLTQRPGRSSVFAAKMVALGIAIIPFVLAAFGIGVVSSAIIATVEDLPIVWPSAQVFIEAMLSGWLIMAVWAAAGVILAMLTRGTSLAIGIGILWTLAFEGLLSAFANSISWMEWVVDVLLRANGYSLVRAVAGTGEVSADGPGSFSGPFVSGTQAAIVLGLYLVAFLGGSWWLLRRRDVA